MLLHPIFILTLFLLSILSQLFFSFPLHLKPILMYLPLYLHIGQLLQLFLLFFIAAYSFLSYRLLITLLVDYIQALLPLIVIYFSHNNASVFGYLFECKLLKLGYSFFVLESIGDFILHVDGMVHETLFFLQIDIVDLTMSIDIWSPLRIQLFN